MEKTNQILTGLGMCLSWIIIGIVLGYPSPAIPSIENDPSIKVSESKLFFLGSITCLGAAVGAVFGALLMGRMSRKMFIAVGSGSIFAIGFLLNSVGPTFDVVLVGRFISGISLAWCCATVPVYITETIHKDIRGAIGFLPELSITIGFLLDYSLGMVLSWRYLADFGIGFVILFLVVAYFLPESPVWLIKMGREQDAAECLRRLRGQQYDVTQELDEMKVKLEEDKDEGTLRELVTGWTWRPFLLAVTLLVQQQLSGINVVLFFTSQIFEITGTDLDDNMSAIIVGIFRLIGGVFAAFISDRFGRKPLLITSFVGMAASLSALGGFFYCKAGHNEASILWLPLPSLILYVLFYSIGVGPIPWLYMSEILPSRLKNVGASAITCLNWSVSALVTFTFHPIVQSIGSAWTFWIYAILCVLSASFCGLVLFETKRKSTTEIETYFKAKHMST